MPSVCYSETLLWCARLMWVKGGVVLMTLCLLPEILSLTSVKVKGRCWKLVVEEAEKEKKYLYCIFLDIEKAYDTVNRKIMWELVERMGFDEQLMKYIRLCIEIQWLRINGMR